MPTTLPPATASASIAALRQRVRLCDERVMLARLWRMVRAVLVLALAVLATGSSVSRADTVASLLGNFTINQYCGLRLSDDAVIVHYTIVLGQLPALRELHAADTDGDGVTTQAERDAYAARLAPGLAEQLQLTVDGISIPLHAVRWSTSLPTEQGGFSLRLDVDYTGALPRDSAQGEHMLAFANQNYAGRFGWQEIVVESVPAIKVFATDAFNTSLTAGLTDAVTAMPATGPLNERAVKLRFTHGAAPAGAQLLQARPGTVSSQVVAQAPAPAASGAWLQRQTRRLIDSISTQVVPLHVAVVALLAALLLGALHALSPGHGKTVVGAYLIGSRATPRHALFLGLTVTITHTLGVFALGFATLFASRYVMPERLFPVLGLLSGLIVLGMGVVLLVQRWPMVRPLLTRRSVPTEAARSSLTTSCAFRPVGQAPSGHLRRSFVMAYASGDRHHAGVHYDHDGHHHSHDHTGTRDGAVTHSHGGPMHSHLPPGAAGEKVTWRSLLALGISGGIVPCPSAMVLLLAAIALNKVGYGLLLVVAFSVGLAMTLTAIGMTLLYARNRIPRLAAGGSWPRWLPVLSAAAIVVIGTLLAYAALTGGPV
jgi:nickel/cobalt transporter (NicO) family protein